MNVASPTNRAIGSITRANAVNWSPKLVAWPTSASATAVADTTDRNSPARLNDSFQLSERVARRLQCSVERIWSDRGIVERVGLANRGRPPCRRDDARRARDRLVFLHRALDLLRRA